MTRTDAKITRYADGKFMIDIVDTTTMYEAWLRHESYGCSDLMFGVSKDDNSSETTYEAFLNMVLSNLAEYEKLYAEEHFD